MSAWVPHRPRRLLDHPVARLTDGQRYTSVLALLLAAAFVGFGMPSPTIAPLVRRPSVASITPNEPPLAGASSGLENGPNAFTGGTRLPAAASTFEPTPLAPAGIGLTLEVRAPKLVALVRSGGGVLPGRDEAGIAGAMLAAEGLEFTEVQYDRGDTMLCQRVLATGLVVVAGEGIDVGLRDCLVTGGALTIAYDELGERQGTHGAHLSARRAAGDSLIDLARWGMAARALAGPVGLVVAADLRPSVEPALSAVRAAGVNVVAVVYLDRSSSSPAPIGDGVRSFAAAGVETVVFAVPVSQQRDWLSLETLLGPSSRHVVSDLAGSVIDEAYPPLFDGALAHVALRGPWFARAHGETPEQTTCLSRWAAVAVPGSPLDERERTTVLMWCQHAGMAAQAIRVGGQGVEMAAALRRDQVASTLTSTLGPLPDGTWGPTEDAVLVWQASCECWREVRAFAMRRA